MRRVRGEEEKEKGREDEKIEDEDKEGRRGGGRTKRREGDDLD